MRSAHDELSSPYPLAEMLPAVLQEDELLLRLTEVFDRLIAPSVLALECLPAYVDPWLAPADFLDWLGTWIGITPGAKWPARRRSAAVATAVDSYRVRGTVAGLAEQVRVVTGTAVRVHDSGGVSWSTTPDAEFEPSAPRVTVRVADDGTVDRGEVAELLATAAPAGVPVHLELVDPAEFDGDQDGSD